MSNLPAELPPTERALMDLIDACNEATGRIRAIGRMLDPTAECDDDGDDDGGEDWSMQVKVDALAQVRIKLRAASDAAMATVERTNRQKRGAA